MNMFGYCWYACFVMQCFVMSGMSSQSCYHNSVYAMLCFSAKSETVNKTCYVYMGAIISSVPFWLMFSKGLSFYAFSRIMPCLFSMICSCSMLLSCSKHCFLMLIPDMLVFSLSLWCWYLLHFCHACLNLLQCDLAVAQCSCFVKHLLYITAICFVFKLGWSSIASCCILSGILLLIAE